MSYSLNAMTARQIEIARTRRQYADQRAHDVAWMTASEREAYGERMATVDDSVRAAAELAAEFGTDISEWTV